MEGAEGAPTWALVTYRSNGREAPGILRGDGEVVTHDALAGHGGVLALLRVWEQVAPALRELDPDRCDPVPGAEILAPVRVPGKLICAGANYRSHLEEMGVSLDRDRRPSPFFFLKPASNTVIGPGAPIRIAADGNGQVDWEAELGVVIGRQARRVSRADAPSVVAGYTIVNDLSARAAHRRPDPFAPPFEFDWLAAKGRDTFCPMGPGITPAWLVPDPHALGLRLWVNGELKQNGSTDEMLIDVWDLLAAASEIMTLEPGDVVATGTPSGVGKPRGEFLAPGDEVEIEIDRLGRLANPVEAQEP